MDRRSRKRSIERARALISSASILSIRLRDIRAWILLLSGSARRATRRASAPPPTSFHISAQFCICAHYKRRRHRGSLVRSRVTDRRAQGMALCDVTNERIPQCAILAWPCPRDCPVSNHCI